jgi:hypothetical protein
MKKLSLFCILALAIVVGGIASFGSSTVSAQATKTVRVDTVVLPTGSGSTNVTGTVVGFDCVVDQHNNTRCYVATQSR